ncbi:Uncharacterised protein [Serratia grimesii]|jgi:hypothetical protein|uniref:DUF1360 domain-containing protein n=1 Tax=Serratia grimesii TaxID=82995 RepID=UPI0010D1FFB8|nr:DUF1360 domain-containing protein [Serratia grimesii]CAI1766930.1 Uncharacterised protein [Serratia grimesii]CAI2787615.1 Uncharacterised protein [Serratia grimesii]
MTAILSSDLSVCLMIALASASISMTVTQTELFAALRAWTARKNDLLGHLFKCFYCMSHWVVIAGMLIYRPTLMNSDIALIDWVMTAFIVLTITTFINGLLFKAFQAAIHTHVMKHEAQQLMNPHEQ